MASSSMKGGSLVGLANTGKPRGWQQFSESFPDDRDCLASFLALEVAEVLAGPKPANLISVANRHRQCGRNLYLLWKSYGAELVRESPLEVRVLADSGESVLLLFFRPEALVELLVRKSVQIILGKAGYQSLDDLEQTLADLASKFRGGVFPHEIGVFLGYPLKDVVGFLGWARLSFTCQGPWRIFGDPGSSLHLAEIHRQCRCSMSQQLSSGITASGPQASPLVSALGRSRSLPCQFTENEYHCFRAVHVLLFPPSTVRRSQQQPQQKL